MFKFKAYAFLIALLAFIAHFGVYGLHTMLVGSIGQVWAFAGAGVVVLGMLIIAAVGVTMIRSRPSNTEEESKGRFASAGCEALKLHNFKLL